MIDPNTLQADGAYHLHSDYLPRLFYERPGLIVGPDAIHYPSFNDALSRALATEYSINSDYDPFAACQQILDQGTARNVVEAFVSTFIKEAPTAPAVTSLSKVRWSGVLSFSRSSVLESRLLNHSETNIARAAPIAIVEPTRALPPRSYPVLKLLGSVTRDNWCLTKHDINIRSTAVWRHFIPMFSDNVKSGPILCLGVSSCPDLFFSLIAELNVSPQSTPGILVFPGDEPIVHSDTLSQYLSPRTRRVILEATVGEFCSAADKSARSMHTLPLPQNQDFESPYDKFDEFHDVAFFINTKLESNLSATEHHILHDILFQPTSDRWDPFVHNLDFVRSCTSKTQQIILDAYQRKTFISTAVILQGGSGTGKTTLLKRLALNIASKSIPTLWLSPGFYQDSPARIFKMFKAYSQESTLHNKIIAFLDDRFGHATISPRDIALAASRHGIELVLVISGRTSEWVQYIDRADAMGGLPEEAVIDIPDNLDDDEIQSLPRYLQDLGICQSQDVAAQRVADSISKYTRDVLGTLWFLLPETRASLERSVTGEYFRLGDPAIFERAVADVTGMALGGDIVQAAYGFVAVAELAHAPLPTEVLVSALKTDYTTFAEALRADGPAWGLLYGEYSEEHSTSCYRTRNAIVAGVIVRAVNGGVLHGPGSLRTLRILLEACTGSTPAYRSFCTNVLVPGKKVSAFEFEEGIKLYDAAIAALPAKDRTLMHHKGIYMNEYGRNPTGALAILEETLHTPQYPYAERIERDEHIHTSMAACVLSQLQQGIVDRDAGQQIILSHLDHASSDKFINAHSVHLEAGAVTELLAQHDADSLPDAFHLAARAVGKIDRTIAILQTPYTTGAEIRADLDMLETARDEVVSALPAGQNLASDAQRIWEEFRRQDGFVYVARSLFKRAKDSGKQMREAYGYVEQMITMIESEGETPVTAIYAVAAEIYYYWRVQRSVYSPSPDPVKWERLADLAVRASRSNPDSPNPLHVYIEAYARAHLGEWAKAEQAFGGLRGRGLSNRILYVKRDRYLADEGGSASFQGTVRKNEDRTFINVPDLEWSFIADRNDRWPQRSEEVVVQVVFSFAGPMAVLPE